MKVQAQDVIGSFSVLSHHAVELGAKIEALHGGGWQSWLIRGNADNWGGRLPNHHLGADIIQCLHYVLSEGSGRETWQVPGLLAIPASIVPIARQLNSLKIEFHGIARAYREQFPPNTGREALRELLAHAGLGRLHIKHCARQIIVTSDPIESISLSWIRAKRSIKIIEAKSCEKRLLKLDASGRKGGIDAQLNLLHSLSAHDQTRLRQVQDQTNPSVKGLCYMTDGSRQHLGYLAMPALICSEGSQQLPPHTKIPDTPSPTRRVKRRSDARIGLTPYLPAIRVFLIDE